MAKSGKVCNIANNPFCIYLASHFNLAFCQDIVCISLNKPPHHQLHLFISSLCDVSTIVASNRYLQDISAVSLSGHSVNMEAVSYTMFVIHDLPGFIRNIFVKTQIYSTVITSSFIHVFT
jgi:hypothetical protein